MSEYQYFEFQAVDRPLSEADRSALRAMSTRARITATSFTNTYEWGSLKGDPVKLMERWFDLHLYLANWGSRRLMIKWPARAVDRQTLVAFLGEVDCATVTHIGDSVLLDVVREEVEAEDWDDGAGWLAALTPLRAEVLSGDLRLFYVLWLSAVQSDVFEADEPEPMPGLGPMTPALQALATFLGIDADLVRAAGERNWNAGGRPETADAVRGAIAAMTDREKNALLGQVFDGLPHAAMELRTLVRRRLAPAAEVAPTVARTVGELQKRAAAVRADRVRAAAAAADADRRRKVEEAEQSRRARLDAIRRRGEGAWSDVDNEIASSIASGYDKAVALLEDLRAIADENDTLDDFDLRLDRLRQKHARKKSLIERLQRSVNLSAAAR